MLRDKPTDEEVRIRLNMSRAEFYDNYDLSFKTPEQEEAEDLEFILKYYPQEED